MIHVGNTTRRLRTELGLTLEQFCESLADPGDGLCVETPEVIRIVESVEANAIYAPEWLMNSVQRTYGVDLYVLAWLWFGDATKLKEPLRSKVIALTKSWGERAEAALASAKGGEPT